MSGLRSGRRARIIWTGFSFLMGSAAWSCTKGSPPPPRETTAVAGASDPASAPSAAKVTTPPATVQPAVTTAPAAVKRTDFGVYWRELRPALLSGNAEAVAPFAAFPFTVRGEMDDDPVRHVERPAFAGILRQLLAQDVGLSPDPEPLSVYVKRMDTVPPGAVSGATARVASMQFGLGSDGWRLVGAYLGDSE